MNKYITLIVVAITICIHSTTFAQANKLAVDTAYFSSLVKSQNQADKDLLQVKLYDLLKSDKENDWLTAERYFKLLKKTNVTDSMRKVWVKTFPLGNVARNTAFMSILNKGGASKEKEAAYNDYVKKFPPALIAPGRSTYDVARKFVAGAFVAEDNVEKAMFYINSIQSKTEKAEAAYMASETFIKNGHVKEAKGLLTEAIGNAYKYKTIWKDSAGARLPVAFYPAFLNMYAKILYGEKKYQEALDYQLKAYNESPVGRKIDMNELLVKIYIALGKDKEAFEKADELVQKGFATTEMKENLKVLYKKVKGNTGFDEYMENVRKVLIAPIRKELSSKMINEPAPAFTLKDVNGKEVSLGSLKGKTVVVDFWATWCAPCIASFPGMQSAVNKYKDDPNVAFLFIHTWEREDPKKAIVSATKFIKDNKYSFKVLMDTKDQTTKTNKVVSSFKVQGIPSKFVIDKNGNIRFASSGSSGAADMIAEEVIAMIDLVQEQTK